MLDCPKKRKKRPPVNVCLYKARHVRLYYPKMARVCACCV
ncbi:hypothetical protein SB48_HM08orf03394 [Heyndrickxia coagulans]|uniref:Uncharacterized protein n=1 Tax=Heyndrickxia coagulans TaxID=1398 RepID=A0AAN0T686_HEYCO|nr:hypothetical protein SB48_HM08orf03394 [Heyndrickxia coagulans]